MLSLSCSWGSLMGVFSLALLKVFCDLCVFIVKFFLFSFVELLGGFICFNPLCIFFSREGDTLLEGYLEEMEMFVAYLVFVGVVERGNGGNETFLSFSCVFFSCPVD